MVSRAALLVEATVDGIGGGLFHWEFQVSNSGPEDVVIVSLEAPPGDTAIPGSLSAPAGYQAAYDAGLGIVDFIEDADGRRVGQEQTKDQGDRRQCLLPTRQQRERLQLFARWLGEDFQSRLQRIITVDERKVRRAAIEQG